VEPRVDLLRAHVPPFETVVNWHWREWSHGYDNPDFEEWRTRLRSRSAGDQIPFTLVAFIGPDPVGCLSVCHDDGDDRFADCGPWLSGMFVDGRARNLGAGRALVLAAEQRAHALGASQLWVHTSEAGPFYSRCGWTYAHRKEALQDESVLIRDLGPST
jgi:GNAT superfamily N-acetyltransferase